MLGAIADKNTPDFQTAAQQRFEKQNLSREDLDTKRSIQYEKLIARAKTDLQKKAVADFQLLVDKATETKRQKIDAAEKIFTSGVASSLSAGNPGLARGATVFIDSLTQAERAATDDCARGKDPKTVRDTFRTSLKNARETFGASRAEASSSKAMITTLHADFVAETAKAEHAFKETLTRAEDTLRQAFRKK